MRMHLSSVLVHMHVCIRKLRVSCSLSFPKITSQSQDFAILGPKSTLDLRVMLSLENRGPSRKRYRMKCLQCKFKFLYLLVTHSKVIDTCQ